jgi:hypothetical protein
MRVESSRTRLVPLEEEAGETESRSLVLLPPLEDTMRSQQCEAQKRASPEPEHTGTDLNFQLP